MQTGEPKATKNDKSGGTHGSTSARVHESERLRATMYGVGDNTLTMAANRADGKDGTVFGTSGRNQATAPEERADACLGRALNFGTAGIWHVKNNDRGPICTAMINQKYVF